MRLVILMVRLYQWTVEGRLGSGTLSMIRLFSPQLSYIRKIATILTKREKNKSAIFLMFMFIGMILETASIGFIVPVIKVISDPNIINSGDSVSEFIQFLGIYKHEVLINITILTLVIVFVIKNIFLGYFTWYKINFMTILRRDLSNRLFDVYLSQPYTFHLQHNSGRLIQNVSTEVTIFSGRLLNSIATIVSEGLILVGIIILLFVVEPMAALTILLVLGVVGWLVVFLTRARIAHWGNERIYHEGKRIQHLQQGLGGVKDVLFLDRASYFLDKFKIHNALSTEPDQKQAFLQEMPRLWFEILAVSGLAIAIYIMNIQDKDLSSIFTVIGVFAAAVFRLMPSVTRVLAAMQAFRYSLPVLDLLNKEFNSNRSKPKTGNLDEKTKTNLRFDNGLVFDDVTYTYPATDMPSLNNVSLSIFRGECIGIIGGSGAGKSTLVDTLLGLLTPDSGAVLVDSQDIQKNIRSWQEQIGYVPQFIYLTDDSLRNNIAFGIPDEEIDDSLIDKALRAVQLFDFVNSLPDGLNTFVGERGVRLSGGQKQRVGIARALYYEPKVLVLDEATSSLDNITEEKIMKTVHQLHQEKTIIIVAHRLSTIKDCDRLYRLENGTVIEEGIPQVLLK